MISPSALTRDVEAARIPSGEKVTLSAGTEAAITQALGGSYTVAVEQSGLYRIAGADADALGLQAQAAESPAGGSFDEEKIWE